MYRISDSENHNGLVSEFHSSNTSSSIFPCVLCLPWANSFSMDLLRRGRCSSNRSGQ
jgi:hypothetical protein